jgi:hypothetical protein
VIFRFERNQGLALVATRIEGPFGVRFSRLTQTSHDGINEILP